MTKREKKTFEEKVLRTFEKADYSPDGAGEKMKAILLWVAVGRRIAGHLTQDASKAGFIAYSDLAEGRINRAVEYMEKDIRNLSSKWEIPLEE